MSARIAIARPAPMSIWATSAAHERRNAAPTMARPKMSASAGWGMSGCVNRTTRAGTDSRRAPAMPSRWRLG